MAFIGNIKFYQIKQKMNNKKWIDKMSIKGEQKMKKEKEKSKHISNQL